MAVSEMNFISMIGPVSKLNELVNVCGESGTFQPDNVFSFYSNTENFSQITEENPYSEPLQDLQNAINFCGDKPTFTDITGFRVNKSQIDRYTKYISDNVENSVKDKRELYRELAQYKEEIEILKHFYGLNQNISDVLACEYSKAHFGKIPNSYYPKLFELSKENSEKGIELLFFPLTSDDEYQWGFYFADIENEKEINRLFSSLYFEEITLKPYEKTPYEAVSELQSVRTEIYRKIENIDKKISEFWESQKNRCMKFYTKLKELNTYFEIKSYAAQYNDSFILVGWVPKENLESFKSKIKKIKGIEYSTEEGKDMLSHMPPVKLKNNKLFKPFEFFVDTYGMPSYDELDPTAFVAITYSILFGIMFADVGQGLVVSLVGFLMWKLKKMKLGRVLIPCGIFSAIFGTIFGSVFGFEHALDPFYKNVFGLSEKPVEVMNSSTTSYILYIAVGIGVVLLIIAMMLGIYSAFKRKHIGEALFGPNGICGLVLYSSAMFMLVDMVMLHTGVVNAAYITVLIVIPMILLMFSEILIKIANHESDWKPDSWADYIMQSVIELFEVVLSYVTNTVSFSRVGAYVLGHAGMMMVVFTLANMFSGAGYVITVVIGNAVVILLEALLAGIQVLRLEFYEMFSRFFEGQGRVFTPVTIKEDA